MRGKLVFIVVIIIILLVAWQYLPALTIYDQSVVPDFESSKHKKYDDAEPGKIVLGYDSDGDGLLDVEEDINNNGIQDTNLGETDRFDPDSDDDGLMDGEEFNWWNQRHKDQLAVGNVPDWLRAIHPTYNDQQLFDQYKPDGDLDGDGLANILDFDSDNDGWSDGYEIKDIGTDPADPDHDSDGVVDSDDPNPFDKTDSDNDGIPDDWEREHNLDPNDPTDALEDPDFDNVTNYDEWKQNTDPNHPNGVQGNFDYTSLNLDEFYEQELDSELFRISPYTNPKYWRLTAYDRFNGQNWSKIDDSFERYQSTILPEVTVYSTSVSRIYNIEFKGSYSNYMPTAIHTTNMYNLVVDRYLQPYLDPSYIPPVFYDKEMGYYVNEYLYGYDFATLDYEYSTLQLENASAATGSEVEKYLSLSANLREAEKTAMEEMASSITKDTTGDFQKVLKIVNYLKNNYNYNIKYNRSASLDQDMVNWFLFQSQNSEGICVHFASAAAILCRLNNIPARFVTGFALGELVSVPGGGINGTEPEYMRVVREGHKHTWVEVLFDGLGWIPFEATGYPQSADQGTGMDVDGADDTVYSGDGEPGGDGGGGFHPKNETNIQLDPKEDEDKDGLINGDEILLGSNPFIPDTDGDGLLDGPEVHVHNTDPTNPDTDADGLQDGFEVNTLYPESTTDWTGDGDFDFRTDPNNPDTDEGGTIDGVEFETGSKPLVDSDDEIADKDGDGLSDSEEKEWGTNETDPDTDGDGLLDGVEVKKHKTNPKNNDTDGDGIDDWEEVFDGDDGFKTNPNKADTDMDGLTDKEEIDNTDYELDPTNPDVDADKLPDGVELDSSDGFITDPNNPDTDADGLLDGEEDRNKNGKVDSTDPLEWNDNTGPAETDPLNKDSDGGGLLDSTEVWVKLNPLDPNDDNSTDDFDGDGLTDTQEITLGTNVTNWDSDGDKLSDGLEVNKYHTNPLKKDTDGDNITDGQEVILGTDPTMFDTDGDKLNDYDELFKHHTNPKEKDSDNDKLTDFYEVRTKYDNSTVDWDGDSIFDYYTDPNNEDTDGGGAKDGNEVLNGFDPLNLFDDDLLIDDDDDGLINVEEDIHGTNRTNPDTDGDGVEDGEEVYEGSDGYITNPKHWDTDGDNISDGEEIRKGTDNWITNPTKMDSDDDGLTDWEEIEQTKTNPNSKDTDADGLTDMVELDTLDGYTTDPNSWDTDSDGLPDGWKDVDSDGIKGLGEYEDRNLDGHLNIGPWNNGSGPGETNPTKKDTDGGGARDSIEVNRSYNPLDPSDDFVLIDTDGDGLTDIEENNTYGTNWLKKDTDGDELNDFEEIFIHKTNATNVDTDNDTLNDKFEVTEEYEFKLKTSPLKNDTDNDTLLDGDEVNKYGTNPTNPDTDGDGLTDEKEVTKSRSRSTIHRAVRGKKTDPKDWDTDGDGLPDGWIDGWGYNTTTRLWGLTNLKNNQTDRGVRVGDVILAEYEDEDLSGDIEGDTNGNGVWDVGETWNETHNLNPDTDGGGAWDGAEVIFIPTHDPLDPADDFDAMDTDRDGITDVVENQSVLKSDQRFHTKWNKNDTDVDGLWDGYNVDLDFDGKFDKRGELTAHNNFAPTYPNATDSDKDGLKDGQEVMKYVTNPNSNDTDRDGLIDGYDTANELGELSMHNGYADTDPLDPDSDNDGLWDGKNITVNDISYLGEIDHKTNPNNPDSDKDVLTDFEEIKFHHTNPLDNDTDNGGVQDGSEVLYNNPPTDPLDPSDDFPMDSDDDQLKNHYENKTKYAYSSVDWDGIPGFDNYTNWLNNDTDADNLLDGQEVLVYHTNPLHNDTDNDTIPDGEEVVGGKDGYITDPNNADSDSDGLTDIIEIIKYRTNPTLNDTDGGGSFDLDEIKNGTNPLDPSDDSLIILPFKNTEIVIQTFPTNVSKLKSFNVQGEVMDEDGKPVANAPVYIYINSSIDIQDLDSRYQVGSGKTTPDGKFEINCEIGLINIGIKIGENRIVGKAVSQVLSTFILNESWTVNNSKQPNATIYVNSSTSIGFIDFERYISERSTLTIQANLTDITGQPLVNQTISIILDDMITLKSGNTDSFGRLYHQLTADPPDFGIGEHKLGLHFAGAEYLLPSKISNNFFVQSDNKTINITLNRDHVNVDEYIWVNGTLTGIDAEPLSGWINITFNPEGVFDEYIERHQVVGGEFQAQILIRPREFSKGYYNVYVRFPGSEIYSEGSSNLEKLFVKGKTKFSFPEITVFRGRGEISVNVNLSDHQNVGLAGRYVKVEYSLPSRQYAATLSTSHGGSFSFPFKAELTDPLGIVKINLSYAGSIYYNGITEEKNLYIKSISKITVNSFPYKMVRNQGYLISGQIKDDLDDGVTGENLQVYLGGDQSYWEFYTVTTDASGNFKLSVLVPTSFPLGIHPMEVKLPLNEKYVGSSEAYNTIIFSRPIIRVDTNGTVKQGKNFVMNIKLMEDNAKIPIPKSIIMVYINGNLHTQLITNDEGTANYKTVYPKNSDKISILVTYNGSANEYYTDAEHEFTLTPEKPEETPELNLFDQYIYFIIIIIVIIVIYFVYRWWLKRKILDITKMFPDLLSKLEASDKSHRIIYEAYLKLHKLLQRFGVIRAEAETPREFVGTVEDALPEVDSRNLNSLTTLFEEARYSDHRIGKKKRSRAVRNLKNIRHSLDTET
jgi:transglutaminase-like putative cysteine protease